jgi:hypothetical protein
MKTITLTATEEKIDLLIKVAKEMGIKTKSFRELTDEEMGLPGPKVSRQQLEDWLAKEEGEEGFSSAEMKSILSKRLLKSKGRKSGSGL